MKPLIAAILLLTAISQALASPAGLRFTKLEMPHHNRRASVQIWYPNGGGGDETVFAGNAVFEGVDAAIWAEVQAGQHPVVLFSHGMGGAPRAQAWLAAGLARRGAIVVAVTHANSTWGDFDMAEGIKHWTRVADLSVALDGLMADPDFAGHIDPTRIMAAGFSYGGWTALSMGGLKGNLQGAVDTCLGFIDTMEACELLMSDAVNMQALDPAVWNANHADPRITHVAAIEPGFVWGLTAQDTAALVPNLLLIGLGGGGNRMLDTDFDKSGLAELLPNAHFIRFDPAFHFTAMPICTQAGEAILRDEGDDPVCTDPAGTDRATVHAGIIDAIAGQLGL